MENFGQFLKHERELRGVPLEEIAGATKIHIRFLQALEDNRFEEMPGEVFVKGYLKSYAKAIGYDVEDLLRAYDNFISKNSSPPAASRGEKKKQTGRKAPLLVGGGLAVGVAAVGLWFAVSSQDASKGGDPDDSVPAPMVVEKTPRLEEMQEPEERPDNKIPDEEDAPSQVAGLEPPKPLPAAGGPSLSEPPSSKPADVPEKETSEAPAKKAETPKPEIQSKRKNEQDPPKKAPKTKPEPAKPAAPPAEPKKIVKAREEIPKPASPAREVKPEPAKPAAPPAEPKKIVKAREETPKPASPAREVKPPSPPDPAQSRKSLAKAPVELPSADAPPPETPIESQETQKNSDSEQKEVIIQSVAEKSPAGNPSGNIPVKNSKSLHLLIQVQGNSWFNLAVDGKPEEDFILPGGTAKSFYGNDRFRVTIGNRRGTQLFLNGQALDIPLTSGDVVRNFEITSQILE